MRDGRKKLPIGIDNFGKIRTNDFYYVDKHYADKLGKGPFDRILKYGIACYQKECRVAVQ